MTTIDEIRDNFALLDEWDDRYRYVIELGRTLEPLSEAEHSAENKVQGCVSQVWLSKRIERDANGEPRLIYLGDSDAHIVRGLVAIVLTLFSGQTPQHILATDALALFDEFGFRDHLTPQRSNGLRSMVDRIRKVIPNEKLAYNNSPSFNWTLNFRWQVYDAMKEAGQDVSKYNRAELMKAEYDDTPLAKEADERIRTFQADSAKRAGIFHHLITLPTYHTAALSTDNLAREYFGEQGMLGYVKNVQRAEIRQGIACVKHQNMAGSDIGDDHKEYFAGEAALKAGGAHNTMNQFG